MNIELEIYLQLWILIVILFLLIILISLFCSELKRINKTKADVEFIYKHIADEVKSLVELHQCMKNINKDITKNNVDINAIKYDIKDLKEFNETFKNIYSYNKLVDKNWIDKFDEKLDKLNTNNINNSEKTSIINQLDSLKSQIFKQLQEYNNNTCKIFDTINNDITRIKRMCENIVTFTNNTNEKIKAVFSLGSDFDADKARLSQQKRNRGKKPKSATTFDNGDNA